jgi:4-hydroxyphenylacetate 3-monooxygenase
VRRNSSSASSVLAANRVRNPVTTEFGNRHAQYEKFYGGASFLVKQNVDRFYDYKRAISLVDAALALPPVAGA